MTIRVALEHRTTYHFAHPVKVYPHTVRLRPAPHSRTPIESYSLQVTPQQHFVNWQQDPFGNWVARLVFPEPVSELDITVGLVADMTVINPFDFFVEEYAERFPFVYPDGLRAELEPYLTPVDDGTPTEPLVEPTGALAEVESKPGDIGGDSADASPGFDSVSPSGSTGSTSGSGGSTSGSGGSTSGPDGSPGGEAGSLTERWVEANRPEDGLAIVDFLVRLNQAVNRDIAYTVRLETGVQDPDETLAKRLGSCRDSAWLLVSALRRLGLAARFVSGYLVQLTSDVKATNGKDGPSEDFTDLHAWAEVFVPGAGWIGLDATSGLFAGEGHIPLSATPHPSSAAPISGATGVVDVDFSFSNSVTRIHEDARVTKPYSEEQWRTVDTLGQQVDRLLTEYDVRLTMGGEPTFVSAGDTSSAQWESAADGDEKRSLARDLADRLKERWASHGLVHHGQGKWYPGEPLPRWQIRLTWRADGKPLWEHPELLDDPWGDPREIDPQTARDLAYAVATGLGVPTELALPAYEDPMNDVWNEARRPRGDQRPDVDIDPNDPEPMRALEDVDSQADTPRGWVVPIFRDPDGGGWATTRWRTRRRHLFLTPGESPMGLRLPLGSIAWTDAPYEPEESTFGDPGELSESSGDVVPAVVRDIEKSPRTALCVQERDGHLFVFLPPLSNLDHALQLLATVERAVEQLGVPVVLEGYPLPDDRRTRSLSVTPDPGVIEVNVQPSASWTDLAELTTTLFDDARDTGLATEKFDLDGTHTGTGGGNHLTLGGPTPQDSPLLRRPDLLRSLLTYWQHHPALSYVFSGRFIGPTSQAPRVDEGRPETLYELEIAFAELERAVGQSDARVAADVEADRDRTEPREARRERHLTSQLWLTDRLLRHLLTDITGNTHRSEFCVDKLYSPDSERGRLGLLELRGFEMPPHPRMALVQALLVRSLVARFWREPYTGPLVRWGTRLHDRFLLPAFAAADLRDVVEDLNRFLADATPGGLRFDPAWFDPFLEFRFPRLGETDVAGVHLELRQAVEPWHVLGEEVRQSGTARYVDSSVERVQVAASGLVEGRHVVTCNGVPVPMVPVPARGGSGGTGTAETGSFVGGVRFRAWAPPSALHPTIGVHAPLTFDLVDTWSRRSLGGFTHHVVHPGGRAYEDYPVNAAAAETRRASRFEAIGHTTGEVDPAAWPDVCGGTEYPATLDLRRFTPGHR
ncbi:transglutaminase family protein [Luteipulveratus sp. YIM 133132]|uniref:transglutaminase family protein n=1 Tax=Luteipulveratus flavus TaxID=3031728 RepID=UPI0023B149AF|nr:transglutaminase family protein [Luteipulveratus sp. YIM 133132]MDE9366616.1 transglutaminase family protein [Luteipulveratus sp. YIM 133132]